MVILRIYNIKLNLLICLDNSPNSNWYDFIFTFIVINYVEKNKNIGETIFLFFEKTVSI